MKKIIEFDVTPEQEADIKLLEQGVKASLKLFSYKNGRNWKFSDPCEIIAIGNIDVTNDIDDLGHIPQISPTLLSYTLEFFKKDRIATVSKEPNKPFVLTLKSGLFILIAPRMGDSYEIKKEEWKHDK